MICARCQREVEKRNMLRGFIYVHADERRDCDLIVYDVEDDEDSQPRSHPAHGGSEAGKTQRGT